MEHNHTCEHTKAVINQMPHAAANMEAIKKMGEEGCDCSEVRVQIAAVKSAINNCGKIILKDHTNHCAVDAVSTGNQKVLDDFSAAVNQFLK